MRRKMQFQVVSTLDGSPTLRLFQDGKWTETMHSPKGAWSETLYIYADAMKAALEHGWPLRVFSLGLGLGYNELVYAAHAVQLEESRLAHCHMSSYEAVTFLSESFLHWIEERPVVPSLGEIYAQISTLIGGH